MTDIHSCSYYCDRPECIKAQRDELRERLAQPEQEPVLETVYETIIQWDEGGGKRSRRELARRIVAIYTTPPQRKPLTDELLETLEEIAYGLESARIWGGMDWSYNPLHPFKYLPLRDKARAAIAKATGEKA